MSVVDRLASAVRAVRDRVERSADRGGRDPSSVTLVAVTKYVGVEIIRGLYDLGVRDFGESRPQSLWEKAPELPADVRWHMIGHWQTNKVRRALPWVHLVHSVDRWGLFESLDQEAARLGRPVEVLLEFKLVQDEAKHGFLAADLDELARRVPSGQNIRVRGLMTMASLADEAESARPVFQKLRQLREELSQRWGAPVDFLSMGMSQDFEVAVEEGATHVRVGSILFEGLESD